MISFNDKNITKELVVSRYNEDVAWLKQINCVDKITLYNKGNDIDIPYIRLDNTNREAHTYFYHIVSNYNNLADVTLFCQGNPFEHMQRDITPANLNEKMNGVIIDEDGVMPLLHYLDWKTELSTGCSKNPLYSLLLDGNEPDSGALIVNGAQLVVLKENILSKSYEFYTKCLNELHHDKKSWDDGIFNAWMFESMWLYIFDKNIREKI